MRKIEVFNAHEGNLRNVSLTLPKEKLIVLTGVSGSGKSTFLIDVLFNECQRQYLEAMGIDVYKRQGLVCGNFNFVKNMNSVEAARQGRGWIRKDIKKHAQEKRPQTKTRWHAPTG